MDEVLCHAILADQQREVAWVNRHAWKYAHLRERGHGRSRREAVARVLRALAARLAPVEAEAANEHGQFAVEHRP